MMIRRGDGPGVGGDRGKGRGGPAARMQRMADELGLSPAQRKQVRDIYEGVRPQMDATRSQMRIERQRLRDELLALAADRAVPPRTMLEALKVLLRDLRGALLTGLTLGKRRLTLEKVREWSLKLLPGETMQVLMIWIDS